MKRQISVTVPVLVLLLHFASLQASAIDGKWQFVLQTDGGPRETAAEFTTQGDQVTGKWDTTDVKGTFADGKLSLSFPFTSPEANITAPLNITGTLADGVITGTWAFGDYSGTFKATPKPAETKQD
jgi:hypothetical protein